MLIDTHTHLNLPPLADQWQTIFKQSRDSGVSSCVVPGIDVESSRSAIGQACLQPGIFAAAGLQPETVMALAIKRDGFDQALTAIQGMAGDSHTVAIGEIGLDYFRIPEASNRATMIGCQRETFKAQLKIALEAGLPVIIHTRTEAAMADALNDIRAVYGSHDFMGVFHCFTGTLTLAEAMIEIGAYIGVGGMLTFPQAEALRNTILQLPLERIVLETDAPWLTPAPYRGNTNTPAHLTVIALQLAELKSQSFTAVTRQTRANSCQLFPRLKEAV